VTARQDPTPHSPLPGARAGAGACAYVLPPRAGWLRLRFAGRALETDFRHYHQQQFLSRMRRSVAVALVLFVLFAVLDAASLPPGVREGVLGLRLGVIVPALALTWMASQVPRVHRYLQWVVGAAALVCGLGIVGIIWVARAHAFALPYEGIILGTFFSYFLTGLRCVPAAVCGWLTFVAYVAMELYMGLPGEVLLYNAFFLGTANVIGCFGSHFLEQAMRQNFVAVLQLQQRADRDFITGLLNRRAFSHRAQRIWRHAVRERQHLAVAMMDVDHFKHYNDHYGHAAGDESLRTVAQIIAQHARRPLDVCARYGGEEFIVVWYGVDACQAQVLAEKVRAAVMHRALPHAASPTSSCVSISIGLASLLPERDCGLEEALRQADMALYQAKAQGRDRVQLFAPAPAVAPA